MASDILTKLYWTDGSCGSDKDLGNMNGKKICGVSKGYQGGDIGVTYITGTPKPPNGEDAYKCEPAGMSIYKGKNGNIDPLKFGQSHLCYINTIAPLKNISSKDATTCGSGNITLSSVDLGIPEDPIWSGPSKSNFGPIYPAGTDGKENPINKVFCAPTSDNSDNYKTITINTPEFRVEDPTHPAPKYGFVHNTYTRPENEVFCSDRSDLYSANAGRTGPSRKDQAGAGAIKGGSKGGFGGAVIGGIAGWIGNKKYYKYNCRYPNALPDKDFANYRYCAYANTHTAHGNYTLSCNYTLPVSNVTLRNMDRDIVNGNLHPSAQKIYSELVESYCDDLKEKYSTTNPTLLAQLQNDTSISDYLIPDGNRVPGTQLTCAKLLNPVDFCKSYSNNVVDYSGSMCSKSKIGENLYNELWTNFCEQNPSHKRCGCWAITKGNKCTTNPDIDACKTMNRDYGLIKVADERSYEVHENKKQCFTEVCSDTYNSGVWLPPGYSDGCPDEIKICNNATAIPKHNRITVPQVLLCNDLDKLAEDIADTPEELAALKENIDAFIQSYMNREPVKPQIEEEKGNGLLYFFIGLGVVVVIFILFRYTQRSRKIKSMYTISNNK